jgi:aminoglycoside 3-N-acetyltransferase
MMAGALTKERARGDRLAAAEQRRRMLDFLGALALPPDGVLLVHSAFRSLGQAGFEPEPVLEALAHYMADGTLLLPAMSWRAVNPANPVFDARTTPAITGILSESFRQRLATHRSLHPTHSFAGCGRRAGALLGSHHLDTTPCSDNSPFGLLASHGGHVLLLGVEMDSCTLVHHVEERFNPGRYLGPEIEDYRCTDLAGRTHTVRTRRHFKLMRNFWQFEERLAERGGVARAMLGGTQASAFAAAEMVAIISERLQRDPDGTLARPGERGKLM